ncbi:MAG TPA: hypothetical protein VHO84_00840 [Syntrophorhabdaceae bacterium]|nr:hypothetical protein [Syntrophorhabdaceae bacterium]
MQVKTKVENLYETQIKLRDVRIEALNNLTEIQVASRLLLQHEAVRLEKNLEKNIREHRTLKTASSKIWTSSMTLRLKKK